MGIYVRPNSPFYWMNLERPGQDSLRQSTKIPIAAGTDEQRRRNRQLADDAYAVRMAALAQVRYLEGRTPPSPPRTHLPATVTPLSKRLESKGWCYLYFVQRGDMVKIGRCTNTTKRLRQLQTANGEELVLLAATVTHASLEGEIHERFKDLRRNGEWFELTDELRAYIDAIDAGLNPAALL